MRDQLPWWAYVLIAPFSIIPIVGLGYVIDTIAMMAAQN